MMKIAILVPGFIDVANMTLAVMSSLHLDNKYIHASLIRNFLIQKPCIPTANHR